LYVKLASPADEREMNCPGDPEADEGSARTAQCSLADRLQPAFRTTFRAKDENAAGFAKGWSQVCVVDDT
jgi:hypothetical protein